MNFTRPSKSLNFLRRLAAEGPLSLKEAPISRLTVLMKEGWVEWDWRDADGGVLATGEAFTKYGPSWRDHVGMPKMLRLTAEGFDALKESKP